MTKTPQPQDVQMAIGPYVFLAGFNSYQSFRRAHRYEYREVRRYQNEPDLQYVGKGAEKITLDCLIFPQFSGALGLAAIEGLKALADLHEPQVVVDVIGNVFGKWVITDYMEKRDNFVFASVPGRVEYSLTIKKYSGLDLSFPEF